MTITYLHAFWFENIRNRYKDQKKIKLIGAEGDKYKTKKIVGNCSSYCSIFLKN